MQLKSNAALQKLHLDTHHASLLVLLLLLTPLRIGNFLLMMQKSDVLRAKQKAKDFSLETAQRNQRILQDHKQMKAAREKASAEDPPKASAQGHRPQVGYQLLVPCGSSCHLASRNSEHPANDGILLKRRHA